MLKKRELTIAEFGQTVLLSTEDYLQVQIPKKMKYSRCVLQTT